MPKKIIRKKVPQPGFSIKYINGLRTRVDRQTGKIIRPTGLYSMTDAQWKAYKNKRKK